MRLIDADKLIDEYKHMGYDPTEHSEDSYGEGWCIGFNNAVSHCISHVIYAPTVEKRNTGRAVYQAGYAEGYKSAQLERKTGKGAAMKIIDEERMINADELIERLKNIDLYKEDKIGKLGIAKSILVVEEMLKEKGE